MQVFLFYIALCITVGTSQLITPQMMCEATCLKKEADKAGVATLPWNGPEGFACRDKCRKEMLEKLKELGFPIPEE